MGVDGDGCVKVEFVSKLQSLLKEEKLLLRLKAKLSYYKGENIPKKNMFFSSLL